MTSARNLVAGTQSPAQSSIRFAASRSRAAVTLGVVALVAAGCGGSPAGGVSATQPARPDRGVQESPEFNAFRDCLAENGVELPRPGSEPDLPESAVDPAELDAAREACRDKAPPPPSG